MDTNQLHAITAVAETGSFSLAAGKLHLTQPAISKRIAGLEQQLGPPLFDRIGKRISLTEAGALLLPRARSLLRDMDDALVDIHNLSAEVGGRLVMAASHHIGLHRLPPVLRLFTRRYPRVQMDISFLDSEEAYRRVLHGDMELAVVTLAPKAIGGIEQRLLWPDPLAVMTSPDHPLAGSGPTGLGDLLGHPFILPDGNTFTRQLVEDVFRDHGLVLGDGMTTNNLETIKMMVSVGMAWSVLPLSMQDHQLVALPLPAVSLHRDLGYIRHRDHTLTNAARAFIGLLEDQAG